MWECPSTYLAGESFTLSLATNSGCVATLWIMCSPLVECLKNESGGTLGVFDGLGHLLNDRCLSCECPTWMWPFQEQGREFYSWAHLCKGGFSTGSPPYLACSLWCSGCSAPLSYPDQRLHHHTAKNSPPSAEGRRVYKPSLSKYIGGLWPPPAKFSQGWFSAQLLSLAFLVDTFSSPSLVYLSHQVA